jgi:hypothetical protein
MEDAKEKEKNANAKTTVIKSMQCRKGNLD